MSGLVVSSISPFDAADLQDLEPLTRDLVHAAQRVSSAISALACSLADDRDPGAAPLRRDLVEIRARLVFLLTNIAHAIITATSTLLSSAAIVASENPPAHSAGCLVAIESQWRTVLDACVESREAAEECVSAWTAVEPAASGSLAVRPRPSGAVASFLRALVGPEPADVMAASSAAQKAVGGGTVSSVSGDLRAVCEGLTQLEAFWRKRQALFSTSGDSAPYEGGVPPWGTWATIGRAYTSFNAALYSCIDALRLPEPIVLRVPRNLDTTARLKLAWRAHLAA